MEVRIETWFPKSIYIADKFREDLISDLEKEIRSSSIETSKNRTLSVESTHTTDRKLHHKKIFKELSDDILQHVKQYAISLGYCQEFADRCYMADMWYNVSKKGDYIFPHSHPGAFFSGAFYIKTAPDNTIMFYDNLDKYVELPHNPNEISYSNAAYDCIPSRLLIFRSNFVHGVPLQESEGEKIVISFNVIYVPVV